MGAVHVILYGDKRNDMVQIFLVVECLLVDHLKSLKNMVVVRGGSENQDWMKWLGKACQPMTKFSNDTLYYHLSDKNGNYWTTKIMEMFTAPHFGQRQPIEK